MSRAVTGIVLLLALTAAGNTWAAQSSSRQMTVGQWLTHAAHMVRNGNYRGVMVYLRSEQLNTLRVVHRYQDGAEQERLLALTGRPREIIRQGDRVISILPANQIVLITHQQKRGNLLSRVGQFTGADMRAHYKLSVQGSRRLAGRPTRVISIQPQDKYRYGYRILIDTQTYLPLKLNLLYNQHVLEQLMFTEIEYPDTLPDSAFEPSYDIDDFKVVKHEAIEQVDSAPIADTQWHMTALPPGYRLVESGVRTTPSGHVVQQLLFTDGVATASAFIAPADVPKPLIGGTTMGAVHAFGRTHGQYHITVVGQVPAVTVRFIAQHLQHSSTTTAQAEHK